MRIRRGTRTLTLVQRASIVILSGENERRLFNRKLASARRVHGYYGSLPHGTLKIEFELVKK